MNIKKIMIAMLGIAGSAVWIPQAYEQFSDKPSPIDEYPDPPVDESADASPLDAERSPAVQPNGELYASSEDFIDDSVNTSRLELLSALEAFRGPTDRADLAALLKTTPRQMISDQMPMDDQVGTESAEANTIDLPLMTPTEVDTFVSKLQVNAIIRSPKGDWALVDGRIVRPGDELLTGMIHLTAVRSGGLQLSTPVGPRRLLIKPLEIRAQDSNESEQVDSDGHVDNAPEQFAQQAQPALSTMDASEFVNHLGQVSNQIGGHQ